MTRQCVSCRKEWSVSIKTKQKDYVCPKCSKGQAGKRLKPLVSYWRNRCKEEQRIV